MQGKTMVEMGGVKTFWNSESLEPIFLHNDSLFWSTQNTTDLRHLLVKTA